MESDERVEIIERAIRKLMDEEDEIYAKTSSSPLSAAFPQDDDNEKPTADSRRRRHHFLSNLLSELKSMEEVNNVAGEDNTLLSSETDETKTNTNNEVGNSSNEEIIKELENVKRQNSITQSLVTAMIVLTLAWQLSEVSLILKIRDGLTNPLKSVGGIIGGFFRNRRGLNSVQDVIKHASDMQKQVMEPTSLPGLKIPGFNTSDEDED